jgi:hypothetical protein
MGALRQARSVEEASPVLPKTDENAPQKPGENVASRSAAASQIGRSLLLPHRRCSKQAEPVIGELIRAKDGQEIADHQMKSRRDV